MMTNQTHNRKQPENNFAKNAIEDITEDWLAL